MKKLFPLVLTVVAACSAPKDISVRLEGALFLDDSCTVEDFDIYRTGGSMNVAFTASYIAAFATASDLQAINTEIGEDVLQGPSRNIFYVDRKVLRYISYPDGVEIGREEVPTLGTINAATDAEGFFGMDLIGPATRGEIISRASAQPYAMEVEVYLKGKLYSGPEGRTNTVRFPITVFNAPVVCTGVQVQDMDTAMQNSACGNVGQDGVVPQCVDP
jgi:hypothetical protein